MAQKKKASTRSKTSTHRPIPTKKVFWAVDPFVEKKSIISKTAKAIAAFEPKKGKTWSIQPVYTLSTENADYMAYIFDLISNKKYKAATEKALKKALASIKLKGKQTPKVFENKSGSTRAAVQILCDAASRAKADLIVCSTSGTTGLARFLLGSFAETLLLTSRVPVLLINPKTKVPIRPKNILFPTQFGTSDKKALARVIHFAQERDMTVTLFHQVPNPVEPIFASGAALVGGTYVSTRRFADEELAAKRKKAAKWVEYVEDHGVTCKSVVSPIGRNIVDSIFVSARRQKASIIAMPAKSGRLSAAVLGSVVRQVVRKSDLPVWVLHI